jgi:predicted nucleic acid-binding protein
VKTFFDTSVLVAAFYKHHPHHDRSVTLLSSQKKSTAFTAAHCLAELYAVTTRIPGIYRTSPHEARLFLHDARHHLSVVALDEADYLEVLDAAADSGIAGGAIYDALIARCALRAKAQVLYTWNVKHFRRFTEIAARVREPGAG